MTRAELLARAARVEAAEGAETHTLMWRVLDALALPRKQHYRIARLIAAGAYLEAAASLLKPHQLVHVLQHDTYTAVKVWDTRAAMFVGSGSAFGEHAEARARTAAALRAMAEEAGNE